MFIQKNSGDWLWTQSLTPEHLLTGNVDCGRVSALNLDTDALNVWNLDAWNVA